MFCIGLSPETLLLFHSSAEASLRKIEQFFFVSQINWRKNRLGTYFVCFSMTSFDVNKHLNMFLCISNLFANHDCDVTHHCEMLIIRFKILIPLG